MPLRSFWVANAQVGRIRAEETLEAIDLFWIANANSDPEGIKSFLEDLLKRMGEPMTYKRDFTDRPGQHTEGIEHLKRAMGVE